MAKKNKRIGFIGGGAMAEALAGGLLASGVSATQIQIRDFVFLAAEASGVDIRLGVDRNFEDDVAVSLKDITGDTYEGGSLTLTIPDEAFDGRTFNSIGVVCYDNGEVFDWATIQSPAEE